MNITTKVFGIVFDYANEVGDYGDGKITYGELLKIGSVRLAQLKTTGFFVGVGGVSFCQAIETSFSYGILPPEQQDSITYVLNEIVSKFDLPPC